VATTRLAHGTVYDPANGIDGEVRDIWVSQGKVVADPGVPADRVYDLTGLVVMPGGVDIHAHVAGPKVNAARILRPEDRRNSRPFPRTPLLRSGTGGSTPSTFTTGYLYAGMGYTTVFDAAVPPLGARHALEEFHDTPVVDKGFFVLVGDHQYALERIVANEPHRLKAFLGWLLHATRGYALKVVNPGGVTAWKAGNPGLVGLDDPVPGFELTGRKIVEAIATAANELHLPHPLHLHGNRLGFPGNWQTTLDTMTALSGRRAHLTHIQFHSYGGGPADQETMCSKANILADYVNAHPELTVDVGQVLFGETTSMTGDGPLGYYLHTVTGRKWLNFDTECEAGCGIVPITYREKSLVHALQWAVGLEWYLLVTDPWRVAMSTDHPNGAAFVAYPEIVALLMSKDYRREVLKRLPEKLKGLCVLPDLDREYTLNEIAIVTRAGPARMLGLKSKGHLGVGADADVCIYTPGKDIKTMFETPRYVFKAGELIVEQGEIRQVPFGSLESVAPEYDADQLDDLKPWFNEHYSISFENFAIHNE
jgi:formylmethanofuran dehydrogenase subunit A